MLFIGKAEDGERIKTALAASEAEVIVTGWGTKPLTDADLSNLPRLRALVHSAGTVKALLAGPDIEMVEPLATLSAQRWGWSLAYVGFAVLMAVLALAASRSPQGCHSSCGHRRPMTNCSVSLGSQEPVRSPPASPPASMRQRARA